jgi:hypothetical protein
MNFLFCQHQCGTNNGITVSVMSFWEKNRFFRKSFLKSDPLRNWILFSDVILRKKILKVVLYSLTMLTKREMFFYFMLLLLCKQCQTTQAIPLMKTSDIDGSIPNTPDDFLSPTQIAAVEKDAINQALRKECSKSYGKMRFHSRDL